MSAIGSVTGNAQSLLFNIAQFVKAGIAAKSATTAPTIRDADGDFDGTRTGQTDAKDLRNAVNLDRKA